MKIQKVECERFAGIQDKKLEFCDGLNLIIGENESGKSTVVDLIYHMLFQDVKLDGRSNADFIDKYFPKTIRGPQGDIIDGTLVFETLNGNYKLKKEWEKGMGSCKLVIPNGTVIKSNTEINKILSEELKHRSGVYGEIVFASQKRQQLAVESIMRALSKKKDAYSDMRDDLSSCLTQAALETGGVSLEKIEKKLEDNLKNLIAHWDFERDLPEGGAKRGIDNAWQKEVGEILKAYYSMKQVEKAQREATIAEETVEFCKRELQMLKLEKERIVAKNDQFQKYREILSTHSLLEQRVKDLLNLLECGEIDFRKWPEAEDKLKQAEELLDKKENIDFFESFSNVAKIYEKLTEKKQQLAAQKQINQKDILAINNAQHKKYSAEGKIAALNLVATIKQLGTIPVEIQTCASGENVEIVDGMIKITEAVEINVPGVMQMQLLPQGIDIESVKQEIKESSDTINTIFAKYNVTDIDALNRLDQSYKDLKNDVDLLQQQLEVALGERSWEDFQADSKKISQVSDNKEDIQRRIDDLCGVKSLETFIGGLEEKIKTYEEKYNTKEELRVKMEEWHKEKEKKLHELNDIQNIPEEYQGIDVEQFGKELQEKLNECDDMIEKQYGRLTTVEKNMGEKSAEDYSEDFSEKYAEFVAKKEEYMHWRNIHNTFLQLKEKSYDNPMAGIEAKFKQYLDVISDGHLELNSIDEKMSAKLSSTEHALTYNILSEGTKDTISLAFRLAMLEYLYPEGDGLVILDDPFTDMDPKRTAQACKLIEKFAESNQVIFITCDGKYKSMMRANVIPL